MLFSCLIEYKYWKLFGHFSYKKYRKSWLLSYISIAPVIIDMQPRKPIVLDLKLPFCLYREGKYGHTCVVALQNGCMCSNGTRKVIQGNCIFGIVILA
jgi:hypothetical protein